MPEHNEAESRSHFAAWAVVSAPLVLGFDLADDAKVARAWPVISNKEVIQISQTWVADATFPSGRLLRSWQAANAPTVVRRGGGRCDSSPCVDDRPDDCARWAKAGQCMASTSPCLHNACTGLASAPRPRPAPPPAPTPPPPAIPPARDS